jgi:hypothetical protein
MGTAQTDPTGSSAKNACDRIVRCDMFFLNEQALNEQAIEALPGMPFDRRRRFVTCWSPGRR